MARTPRRPILHDPNNPLEEWLSGKRVECHPDGRLRRHQTLYKLAWCAALLGFSEEEIAAAVAERDAKPQYHKFYKRSDGTPYHARYVILAKQAIRSHEQWAERQASAP